MQKKLKQFALALVMGCIVAASPVHAQQVPNVSESPIDAAQKKICLSSPRVSEEFPEWGSFGDSFGDFCGSREGTAGLTVITESCDCGPKHCWNTETSKCEKNSWRAKLGL